jgi:hypothetical protein
MRPPIKLSAIDQEHLQELYDSTGVARDELPYTEAFDKLHANFQDRTFKNAEKEQLFVSMCKHVRSSTVAACKPPENFGELTDDELKTLKPIVSKHSKGGKLLPYSDEIEQARKEFCKVTGKELDGGQFWRAMCKSNGAKRVMPPRRAKVAAAKADDGDDE